MLILNYSIIQKKFEETENVDFEVLQNHVFQSIFKPQYSSIKPKN